MQATNLAFNINNKNIHTMKKILFILVFLGILGVYSINAQIAWGARVGLCHSTITDSEGKPSIELGPTAYYSLNEKFYLNSGLMFSVKNFDWDSCKLRGYFLEVPFYAGYAFSTGNTTFYTQAGPFVGFKIGESSDYDFDLFESINAGLGLALGVNIKKFKIELGYQQGLVECLGKIGSAFAGISYVF